MLALESQRPHPRSFWSDVVNTGSTMRLFRRLSEEEPTPTRLHIGCGTEAIPGWVNIDNREFPGVDRVLNVKRGLPFKNVPAIYAEHFLEHLELEDGLAFLSECRRALAPDGILRLSTPNLDWVLQTHYLEKAGLAEEAKTRACFDLNRAFHAWGHRFLYNREMLTAALRDAGFEMLIFRRYGESEVPALRGLERHETWHDSEKLPHVLVIEATGTARARVLPEDVRNGYTDPGHGILMRLKLAAIRRLRRIGLLGPGRRPTPAKPTRP